MWESSGCTPPHTGKGRRMAGFLLAGLAQGAVLFLVHPQPMFPSTSAHVTCFPSTGRDDCVALTSPPHVPRTSGRVGIWSASRGVVRCERWSVECKTVCNMPGRHASCFHRRASDLSHGPCSDRKQGRECDARERCRFLHSRSDDEDAVSASPPHALPLNRSRACRC